MSNNEPYAQLSLHRHMLRDEVRNEAYRNAINQVVRPGQAVLDMGAGTGILSIFAAQAGARRVYAVERTDIAIFARRMIEDNGQSARIEVIQGDLEDIDLPEKVDVIISEWMGGLGVDENMLAPLVMARNRWLKPGGKIVPERVTAFLAPAWVDDIDEGLRHWRSRPHGVEMSAIAAVTANEMVLLPGRLGLDDLLAEPQRLWSHDAYTCSLAEADRTFEAKVVFTAARAGRVSGLTSWFIADLGEGCTLTNAVGAPDTHWGQVLLPLERTVAVEEGTRIEAEVRCEPTSPGGSDFYWSVRIGDGPIEHHDTGRTATSR